MACSVRDMDGKMLQTIRAIELDIVQSDYRSSFGKKKDQYLRNVQHCPQNAATNAPPRDLSGAMAAGSIVQVCPPPGLLAKQHYFSSVLGSLRTHIAAKGQYVRTRETSFPV